MSFTSNPLETLIQSLLIVARDGDRALWSYPIYPRAADSRIETLPVQPKPPASPDNVVQLPLSKPIEKKDTDAE